MLLRKQIDRPELLLLDVPLFAATCGSITVFYLVTHKALYGSMRGAFSRLPLMMALGIGLSINNARAVLEGLFGRDLEFVRTPKHGIVRKQDDWKRRRYRSRRALHSLLEIAFGLYFVVTVVLAVVTGSWVNIPFLILFLVGYLYVGTLSLVQARA